MIEPAAMNRDRDRCDQPKVWNAHVAAQVDGRFFRELLFGLVWRSLRIFSNRLLRRYVPELDKVNSIGSRATNRVTEGARK
jgi:hypothetical protein